MQRVTTEGKRWFSGPVDFEREEDGFVGKMNLDCFSCNGGYYSNIEWGDWNYDDVKEVREEQSLSIWDIDSDSELQEHDETIQLAKDWGRRMAESYLSGYEGAGSGGRHVVIFPCPGNLYHLKHPTPEIRFRNCYYNHLAYHIGLSFSTEMAKVLGCQIPVILPHGFLIPGYRHSTRGKPWSRTYLRHAPSDLALQKIRDAEHIHIIDDNVVYGGTMARMIVGAFLACEEVGNHDANLNIHTWYAQTKKPTRYGGGTPIEDMVYLAKRIDWVKLGSRHIAPFHLIDEGVIIVEPRGRIEPDFWNIDLLAERRKAMEAERKLLEQEREHELQLKESDDREERLRRLNLEERLALALDKQKSCYRLRNKLVECRHKLDSLPQLFVRKYIEAECKEYLISEFYILLDYWEGRPWMVEDGNWGMKFKLTREYNAGEYITGEDRILCKPSPQFMSYVVPWEGIDVDESAKEVEYLAGEFDDFIEELEERIGETNYLRKESHATISEIEEICDKCLNEYAPIDEECRLSSLQTILNIPQLSIGQINSLVDEMKGKIISISWEVELLWDTEEKANRGLSLEKERDELVSQLPELMEDYRAINFELIPDIIELGDELTTAATRVRDFSSFWEVSRTEHDLDERMERAVYLRDDLLERIKEEFSKLETLFASKNYLIGNNPRILLEAKVKKFRELSLGYR